MDLMTKELIMFDVEAGNKGEVINKIADAMEKDGRLLDRDGYVADVLKRESEDSTAIGFGIATPHAKSESVKEAALAFVRLKSPIAWEGADGTEQVSCVFQIAVPAAEAGSRHLDILAMLFRKLVYEEFQEKLLSTSDPAAIIDMVGKA